MEWPIVGSRWLMRSQNWIRGTVVDRTRTGRVRLDFSECGLIGMKTAAYEPNAFDHNARLRLVNEAEFLCFIGRPS